MIEQGQQSVEEFGEALRALRHADVRVLLCRLDERVSMLTAVVNAVQGSAEYHGFTHDYGDFVFAAARLDGECVADWLADRRGKVDGIGFSLPEPTGCRWTRRQSGTYATGGTLLSMPQTDYEVGTANRAGMLVPAVLAGRGLPFFPDVNVAAASLLFDIHSTPSGWAVPPEMMLVRFAHPEAYFEKVRVSTTAIVASVGGEKLGDVYLQVSGAGQPFEDRVSVPRSIRVPRIGADRTDTWVALTRGHQCLDFRDDQQSLAQLAQARRGRLRAR